MLVQGGHGRCTARGAVCGGLQHPMVAAGHYAPGAAGAFCALVLVAYQAGFSAGCAGGEILQEQVGRGRWVNSAGPTT